MSDPVVIPLQAVADQTVQAYLGGQNCSIRIYQRTTGLFCDFTLNNVLVFTGVQCFNMNKLVRNAYYRFTGDIYFSDTDATDDPNYSGLGTRFVLLYKADA